MATFVTHFIVGASVSLPFCRARALMRTIRPGAFVVLSGVLAVLPDMDTLYVRWVPYGEFLGHRGFWHSPFLLALLAVTLALCVSGLVRGVSPTTLVILALTWAAASITHPVLDALTDGGLGVMMAFPFSQRRFFFGWQPIHVARIGVSGAVQSFQQVFPSELPFCAVALVAGLSGYLLASRGSAKLSP